LIRHSRIWTAAGVALGIALALPAAAAEECEGFLPDFRCEREARYEGFVAPLSMPYVFEEPFVTTGLSGWYIYNEFPEKGLTGGGSATVYALQLRMALTDRIALIATQDGYMQLRPDLSLLDDKSGGWENLMAGVKVALVDLPEQRFILSPSLRFQTAQGSEDVLAGNGHGIWVPGVSLGWGPGPVRMLGNVAAFSALDIPPEEGNDVLNFGSKGVDENDIVSFTVGARMQLMDDVSLGVGWEHPITKRKDLLQNRLYINLTWEL
jgi:hypothetical protein